MVSTLVVSVAWPRSGVGQSEASVAPIATTDPRNIASEKFVPVELTLAGRALAEPRVAPDGSAVVFAARWGPNSGLFRVDLDDGVERLLTAGMPPRLGRGAFGGLYTWRHTNSSDHEADDEIIYVGVDGNLWIQSAAGGVAEMAIEIGDDRAVHAVDACERFLVASIDQAEIWLWDLDRTDLAPRRLDDGSHQFVDDPRIAPDADAVVWQAWSPPNMSWDHSVVVIAALDPTDGVSTGTRTITGSGCIQQAQLRGDGSLINVSDDTGWLNLSIGRDPLVAEPFEHALAGWGSGQRSYAVSPDGTKVAFWRNEAGFGSLVLADVASGATTPIDRGIFSQLSWAGDTLAALRSGARTPTQIVVYDAAGGYRRRIIATGATSGWNRFDLPEPELVEITRPNSVGDDAAGKLYARRYGAGQGRMIVWVHGGPTDQTLVEWNPRLSYWWSRGYDCLVVDHRGSTGHGREFQQALNGGWGVADVDDVASLIAAAHDRGWATPRTTVITGGSAGGMAVLGIVTQHPELVCGGVARYPVSDLAALAASTHRFEAHYTDHLVGDPTDEELYRRHSPIAAASSLRRPLLIFHGDQDPVVPLSSSVAFVEAVGDEARSDVELVVFEGEGHGFRDPEHQRVEYQRTQAAIETWMGDPHG